MGYQESAKEIIKSTADIVEVIGQFVQLRKAGQNYIGLCPFHTEKTPSFTVSPAKQMFHCFGCKKGGDLFAFWMEYHGTTFPEAVKELAERYNIPLSENMNPSQEKRKAAYRQALFAVNEQACQYFQQIFANEAGGEPARAYFLKRGLSERIFSKYRLGYAPDGWDGLARFLGKKSEHLEIAREAGLLVPRKNRGYYDRFRKRVMFPILDQRERIVGFGGRVLDDSLPKYLNTPETPVFHKGKLLYGLNDAADAIRKKKSAIVVEGYMDVLALRNHGLGEVVATLGTALTSEHVRRLKGLANEVVVIFDSDEAGKAAALKSLPLFLSEGLVGKAVALPNGHDPDSFVNAEGVSSLLDLVQSAGSLFDFYLDMRLSEMDGSVVGKSAVIKDVLPILAKLRHVSQQSLSIRHLSERIGVKEDILWAEMKNGERSHHGSEQRNLSSQLAGRMVGKRFSRDLHFLNLLIHYPEVAQGLKEIPWQSLLSDSSIIEIGNTFFQNYEAGEAFSAESLLNSLASEGAREQLREGLLQPSFYSDLSVNLAIKELEEKIRQIELARSIRKAREQGDLEDLNRLLKRKAEGIAKNVRD